MNGAIALAPDAGVPCRDRLLNVSCVRARLERRLHNQRLDGLMTVKAKYRVGHSLRVVYRVSTASGSTLVTARTFSDPAERVAALARPHTARVSPLLLPPVFAEPDLGAVFWTFPNDRRLDGLDRLLSAVASPLRRLSTSSVQPALAGYTPEKCAVVAGIGRAGLALA